MERLTPLAAAFLHAEDSEPATSMAIASTAIFEGPPPPFDDFVATIGGRLPLVPRYRQRIRPVPFDLGAPVWVDEPHVDLRWHIRRTALPPPGGQAELATLMSRVMSQRMDRRRPLWEYWFCEGLEDGRWALISKVHHCLVDGVSGTELYNVIFDPTPTRAAPVDDRWEPQPAPSTLRLTAGAIRDLALTPLTQARVVGSALLSPATLARRAEETVRGLVTLSAALLPATRSSLVGPIGPHRRYTWTTASLTDVRTIRRALGGTVNDVALAAISGGFRALLLSRGEQPTEHAIRSLVPVSAREPGEESIPDNRVSLMLPFLPVEGDDAVERLRTVRTRIAKLRKAREAEAGENLTALAEREPFLPVALGVRLGFHLPQRQIVTVTTNVPGPRRPIYALGHKVLHIIPYVPIASRIRIGISIFSYGDDLTFGITGDYDSAPDLDVLTHGIDTTIAELLAADRGATERA